MIEKCVDSGNRKLLNIGRSPSGRADLQIVFHPSSCSVNQLFATMQTGEGRRTEKIEEGARHDGLSGRVFTSI